MRWPLTLGIASVSLLAWSVALAAILNTPPEARRWLWPAFIADTVLMAALTFGVRWVIYHRVLAIWQRRAVLDDLTELLRPGLFWEETETRAHIRGAWTWVIVYCDLNDFKQCNDHWGHATGDTILRMWGEILREESREQDLLRYLGGEEVGWWFPQTTETTARIAVERVLHRCQATPVTVIRLFLLGGHCPGASRRECLGGSSASRRGAVSGQSLRQRTGGERWRLVAQHGTLLSDDTRMSH